jgi:hypothetical protein
MTFKKYLSGIWSASSQWLNVVVLLGHPNESISGRAHREPWPTAKRIINKMFWWQRDHCKSAYTNDLKWAQAYIEQDKSFPKE